jgi:uncharacterized protein (TIGR03067 family)
MRRLVLIALAAGLLVPATAVSQDSDSEAISRLRGTWVQIEQAGKKPKREFKLIVNKLDGYRMGGISGEASDIASLAGVDGNVRVDTSKTPPNIDLVGSKNTLRGIFKLEGDRLTLLVGPDGRRPTSFDKGDGVFHIFVKEEERK